MPGTVRLELYSMPLGDALSILMADKDQLSTLGATDVDELLRAAHWVVQHHAEEVALHYASSSPVEHTLRVVNGGFDDDRT
jgi:hypothetical protein